MATVQVIEAVDVRSVSVLGGPTPGYPDVIEETAEAQAIRYQRWDEDDAYHQAGFIVDELAELEDWE